MERIDIVTALENRKFAAMSENGYPERWDVLISDATISEIDIWSCPRCGWFTGMHPAVSRWDNETAICSDCGRDEAAIEFRNGTYRDGSVFLDPYDGEFEWDDYDGSVTYEEFYEVQKPDPARM